MDFLYGNLDVIITVLKPVLIVALLFQLLPLLVLAERRGAAFIQDRIGPHRAYIPLPIIGRLRAFGMIYNACDLVKLLFKENFTPPFAHKWFYILAPAIPVITGLMTPSVLPWFAPMTWAGANGPVTVSGQIFDANAGLLVLFAIGSLSVYGVVLGSWSSNSKYALLGGMRASAMMISYEVSMGLSVLGLLLIVGDLSLTGIVEWQAHHTWGIVVQPVGFLLFLVSMFAECNRNPFDVAEGESELVAGFHTEYGSTKFMCFMTAEYLHVLVASALVATLYLGGYDLIPFSLPLAGFDKPWLHLDTAWLQANLGLVAGAMLVITGFGLLGFAHLVNGRRRHYAKLDASDRDLRLKEYGVYVSVFLFLGIVLLFAGAAVAALVHTEPVGALVVDAHPVYPLWVGIVTAAVQLNVVIGKTLAVCWLFIWVRWTLPRFRYDQIMALGWKVMLNIALVNLLITALIAKLVK